VPSSQSSQRDEMTRPANGASILLYDGECGLCQRAVRWMLRHDTRGRLLYAPLQQGLAGEVFARHALDAQRTNSAVLVLHFGEPTERVAVRSDAILGCLSVIGGRWACIAVVARLVPRALRDLVYNWLARNRYRIVADGKSCSIPTAAERQ